MEVISAAEWEVKPKALLLVFLNIYIYIEELVSNRVNIYSDPSLMKSIRLVTVFRSKSSSSGVYRNP